MILINHEKAGPLIATLAGENTFNQASDQSIARVGKDGLLGGVVYSNYTGASCVIHVSSVQKNFATPRFLWMVFHYPFEQLGCKKVFGLVPAFNYPAQVLASKLGFSHETTLKDAVPTGDVYVYSLYKEHCKWLNSRFGAETDGDLQIRPAACA